MALVSEVEFIPHYINQPLFGDVCSFLDKEDIMFHKFLGVAGRTLIPITLENNPNFSTQHIWSDAVFIKNILKIPKLKPSQLLKLAAFSFNKVINKSNFLKQLRYICLIIFIIIF